MHENPHPYSANTPPPVANVTNEDVKKLFDLLAEGEARLNAIPSVENVTLVMGNIGSGKSTLTQRIAGYDTNLVSVEEGLDFGIYEQHNNQINNSYPTSVTIFPELVQDNSTRAWYYDFPGFFDTRDMAHDVTTSYFIKKVIDKVQRVKILLLVNNSSLTRGGRIDDFIKLLKHVTKFVKNVEKLQNGICLIVTMVPFPELKDYELIQILVESIKEAKERLKKKEHSSDEIKLIDVLLLKQEGVYSRIGISRNPSQEGILSESPVLRENKRNLTALIDKLSFVEKDISDFGYFVPKLSLYDVSKLIKEINEKILQHVENSGEKIQEYFISKENQINDLSQLVNVTSSLHSKLINLRDSATLEPRTIGCVQQLVNNVTAVDVDPVKQSLLPAVEYAQYSSFLHMTNDHVLSDSFKCIGGLKNVIEYSKKSNNWYKFMQQLYNGLLESHSLCTDVVNHLAQHEANVSSKSYIQLLQEHFAKCNHYDVNEFANITLNDAKLNIQRKILDMALKNILHPSTSCIGTNTLVMEGDYIKLSDVVEYKKNCTTSPQIIEILALKRVFIDTDLNMIGDQVQLFIIAPIWESWGARKITLDGLPGNSHNLSKALHARRPNENGFNGKPGLPGKSGGHFVGIWETFINLPDFSVSVNGGQGGPGQNGGNGACGWNGEDAYDDIIETHAENAAKYYPLTCICNAKSSNHTITLKLYEYKYEVEGNKTERGCFYILEGQEGHVGGDGGDGGKGGVGGYPGEAIFIPLLPQNTTNIQVERKTGLNGLDGRGGQGGSGGKFGNRLIIWSPCQQSPRKYNFIDNYKQASMGKNGVNGGNSNPMELPQKKELKPMSDVIKHYIGYAQKNLNDSIHGSHLVEFLGKLNNSLEERGKEHTKQLRAKRQVTNASEPTKSSANIIKSPINTAFGFIGGILGTWKSIYSPNIINYQSIKEGVQSWFGGLTPFNVYTTKDFDNHFGSAATFNAYESLTLMDFFVRLVTKVRPYDNTIDESVNSAEVTASIVNIIAEFEKLLNDVSIRYNLPIKSQEFDPIDLMSRLEKELINGNSVKLEEIIFRTVMESFHNSDNAEFCEHVAQKVNDVFGVGK
ncbi:uncharacterized protein LOC135837996 isoform X1 [Planococcus citri]|uniref:uncharacterized protein LOC135837996 isoform X1 n=1 Tax=Planococcus citri TaxID=170843 RepID=UPI0031F92C3D